MKEPFDCDSPLCESLVEEEAMAEKKDAESRSGKYRGRMTSFVVVSCMVAAVGGALFGYDIGVSGHSYHRFAFCLFIIIIIILLGMANELNQKYVKPITPPCGSDIV